MKISIATTLLILALAAGIGWSDQQRLAAATARNTRLASRAAGLGISSSLPAPANPILITKRERDSRVAADRESVAKFLTWMRELNEIQKTGRAIDDELQKDVMIQLSSFSPSEIEILLTEVLGKKEFDGMLRNIVLAIPMMKLASVNPLTALRFLPEFSGAIPEKDSDRVLAKVIETSLAAGGRTDPLATLAWLRENGDKYSNFIREDDKREILLGIGGKDPALAFKLIGDLEIKNSCKAICVILSACKTPEERTATLTAFRQYLSTVTDGDSRTPTLAVAVLANSSHQDGYDATTRWLASAHLTHAETDTFVSTLQYSNVKNDSPKWIDWMVKNLPADQAGEQISTLMDDWTREDYQAAGKWLSTAPEGAPKNAAIRTYATVVSKYEPTAATQWAMTLPAGKDRDQTLKQIYQNWPREDVSGRQAFAREHGME